ncbi:hypothetical protein CANINC_004739 [Pichia inconspicua]|uniref:Uncharacterized protein n=1 Tax=Pichia inconspicua TaxID=52247 RepID=A0A4T0WW35_9ASCO|nr:hypothetical protein CANINC_004739 [[Candida] inconspicua]
MQQQGGVLAPLNLDSPKLNIGLKLHDNYKNKNMNEEPPLLATQSTKSSTTYSNKSFRLSPIKDYLFESLSPLRTQHAPIFNILEADTNIIEEEKDGDDSLLLRKLEAEDLCNINKDLIEEIENLQKELDEKDRVIHMKSIKLDELIHVNNNLLDELKQEREVSESDFNSWLLLKSELEFEIHALRKAFSATKDIPQDSKSIELENFSKFQSMQVEINKLKKRVNVLMKENELESQSKMMIIDELEMMKGRYIEIETKYKILKQDYDDLVKELLTIKKCENEYASYDDFSPVVTPTLKNSSGEGSFDSINSLNMKKKRISSNNIYEENNSRIGSLRNSSLNRAIREVELKAQRQKYQHEIMMYEFENKSLKLQNEKLLSFIGFSLQVKSKDFNALATKISTSNFDYSDSRNIKTAKRNLKSVIKSVSAMPIRSTVGGDSTSISDMKQSSTNETIDDFMNNSMINSTNNSMEYSTDYEQGEMLPLELGASDSFEEFGDDELDDNEFEGEVEENLLNFDDTSGIFNEPKSAFSGRKNFSSTSSLDVVYKMDKLFQAPNSATMDNGHQFPPLTPRNHVKRLTPSTFNLRDTNGNVHIDTNVIENKEFIDDSRVKSDEFKLDFNNANMILTNEHEDSKVRFRSSSMKNLSSMSSLSQIREEDDDDDDDDIKYDGGDSSFEDEDDADADETINISNAEIDMFKIGMPRRLKCPKHSTFMCFTCSGPLIDPQVLQYQISPIYSLMRRFTSRNNSESSIEQLKWMSKMITGDNKSINSNDGKRSTSPNKKRGRRNDTRELLRHQLYTRCSGEVTADSNVDNASISTLGVTMLDMSCEDFKHHSENID